MCRIGENIYQRKDGRWEGRYMKGRKDNGAIYYGYVYGRTRCGVRAKLLPLKQEYLSLIAEQGSFAGTFEEWVRRWLEEEVRPTVKPSTYAAYYHKLHHYVLDTLGKRPLNQLSETDLAGLVQDLQKERGLAVATIKVIFCLIRSALKKALEKGLVQKNVAASITLPKSTRRSVHSLTKSQQKKIEYSALADAAGLPVLLALHTGLRIGEIAALKWSDIDFDEQLIRVSKTYQRIHHPEIGATQLVIGEAKTETSKRLVPFSKKVKSWLVKQQAKQEKGAGFAVSTDGRALEPRLISYHFKRIAGKAGMSDIHFHQLRHTYATRCLEANGDIVSISALLGHASAKTTMDVYTDSILEQRRGVVLAMEEIV